MHSLIWLKASDYLVRSFSCDFLKIRVPTANYDLQTMFYSYYYNFLKCLFSVSSTQCGVRAEVNLTHDRPETQSRKPGLCTPGTQGTKKLKLFLKFIFANQSVYLKLIIRTGQGVVAVLTGNRN